MDNQSKFTLNIKGKLMDLTVPKVMGIVNITPDSFYKNSRKESISDVLTQVETMINQGADMIDIGAVSSRPGAHEISEALEFQRLKAIIPDLLKSFPDVVVSLDTFRSSIAQWALDLGIGIINDISAGLFDSNILNKVASYKVPYVAMHSKGTPLTMQTLTQYNDLITDINIFFSERLLKIKESGIIDIILDPGIGFAKTPSQNFELISNLEHIGLNQYPLLIGVSRKSFIQHALNVNSENALNGTTAVHMYVLSKGVKILRVHDVKQAKECINIWQLINNGFN
jgi:dihydropteroate synthase